jgi:hypothetical protein
MSAVIRFHKEQGKLVYSSSFHEQLYKSFKDALPEGQEVEAYFDVVNDDKSNGQLAKVHKVIRNIAAHTGDSFDSIKLQVKKKAGLCFTDNEGVERCKSFADCSRGELAMAIQTAEEISTFVGLPSFNGSTIPYFQE